MSETPFKGSKILLVEDEESLAIGLEYNLTEEGYQVTWAKDGIEAMQNMERNRFDLIILDIMLPFVDGFEIAESIRKKHPKFPILILTARKGAEDRIKGLKTGADDYLTKPFLLEELLLRVEGMLKRKTWYKDSWQPDRYQIGEYTINFTNLNCRSSRNEFQLTSQEAQILKYFVEHKSKVISRKELLTNVWHLDSGVETRTVDNFVARLRKYFEPNPANPIYFKSVRSVGYIFDDS